MSLDNGKKCSRSKTSSWKRQQKRCKNCNKNCSFNASVKNSKNLNSNQNFSKSWTKSTKCRPFMPMNCHPMNSSRMNFLNFGKVNPKTSEILLKTFIAGTIDSKKIMPKSQSVSPNKVNSNHKIQQQTCQIPRFRSGKTLKWPKKDLALLRFSDTITTATSFALIRGFQNKKATQ